MTPVRRMGDSRRLILTLLLALGCTSTETTPASQIAPPTPDHAVDEVRAAVARLIAADNARDLDAVLGCYAADAILLPPN